MAATYFINRTQNAHGLKATVAVLAIENNTLRTQITIDNSKMAELDYRKSEATDYAASYADTLACQPGLPEGYAAVTRGNTITIMRPFDENKPSWEVLENDGKLIGDWFCKAHAATLASLGEPKERSRGGKHSHVSRVASDKIGWGSGMA